jgi:hypothetical protein
MELKSLFEVLIKQEKNLKALIKIGSEKKEVLIKNDNNRLNEIIADEERLLLQIQLTEEDRLNIMQEIFKDYRIENERLKLEILVENLKYRVNSKILDEITKSERRIKLSIEEINKINHLNMVLIQQSRSLINETVQAIINASTNKIVDRKG